MIILREAIADGTGHFPKGTIATLPEDRELPPGMVWLRTDAKSSVTAGPHGQVVTMSGDFTPEARRIMAEVLEDKGRR